jgi:hypothetical protein
MPNWEESMQQTFEYYLVDPDTWRDMAKLDNVKKCTINRDYTVETLGSATIDIVDSLGECYVRAYMITIQNGIKEKHPLGTFLVQTPTSSYNGKIREVSMEAYTPLLELKEKLPPPGYSLFKDNDTNIMRNAYLLTRENVRAPVVEAICETSLCADFIANSNDTWLTFNTDLIANADYSYALDEMGRILFAPYQDIETLQPVWTYNDDNSSILLPELTMDHDLYGIPNVLEIVYSKGFYNTETEEMEYYLKIVNDDPNSPTSTVNRGRVIMHREVDPNVLGSSDTNAIATKRVVENYAKRLLKAKSSIEYVITYTHGFCPVRPNDCVRLNYSRAGLTNIKAKVISQSIKCEPGCQVTEKAIFTAKLWG